MQMRSSGRFEAVDGLRGLFIILVILAHSGVRELLGSFLGISMFFTFSGFIITKLLLDEQRRNGRISLPQFWSRRARRLLPPALVTLAVLTAHTVVTGGDHARSILWSLFYGTNWELIDAGNRYERMLTSTNPVHHFWSLAIEEQFYLLWPVVLVGALLLFRRAATAAAAAAGVLLAGAIGTTVLFAGSSVVYYHTATRAGEIAIGALAAALFHRIHPILTSTVPVLQRTLATLQVAVYLVVIALVATVRVEDAVVYRGGLLAFGALSIVVILLTIADGPISRLLRWRPLVLVGEMLYGLYLYHWPVLVLFPGGGWAAWTLKITGVVTLSYLSYRYLEMPVRNGLIPTRYFTAGCVAVIVGCTAALATQIGPAGGDQLFGAGDRGGTGGQEYLGPPKPDGVVRIAIVGDSSAERLAYGLAGARDPRLQVLDLSSRGCPITGDQLSYTSLPDEDMANSARVVERCRATRASWVAQLEPFQPDVVLLMFTTMNQVDILVDGVWTNVTEPRGAAAITAATDAAVRAFTTAGYAVAISTSPHVEIPAPYNYSATAQRQNAYNDLVARYVDQHPNVAVFPAAERLDQEDPAPVDRSERPDGAHFTDSAAVDHARRWMLDTALQTAADAMERAGTR